MSEKTDFFHYIPRRLDDGAKFLLWEMDVAMIGLMGVLVGIDSDFPAIGLFLDIEAAFFHGELRVGKHPDIATHLLYWFTGFPESKELPGNHTRELNG